MSPELQEKLYKKYPKIFSQIGLGSNESLMWLGIACGDGWYMLLDELCGTLQHNIDWKNKWLKEGEKPYPQIEAQQIKEKFGGLRFYINGARSEENAIIQFAENLSFNICEKCGSTDNVSQTKGWITTLCKKCMKERNDKINKT